MYREFAVAGIGVLWRADADDPGDRAHALPAERARRMLIPADGCTDIVLHRDELRIAGPSTRVIHADAATPGSSASVGIRFQPGTASEFLAHPLTELRNQSTVADAVVDSRLARRLRLRMEQLAAAPADFAPDLGEQLFRELREVRASVGEACTRSTARAPSTGDSACGEAPNEASRSRQCSPNSTPQNANCTAVWRRSSATGTRHSAKCNGRSEPAPCSGREPHRPTLPLAWISQINRISPATCAAPRESPRPRCTGEWRHRQNAPRRHARSRLATPRRDRSNCRQGRAPSHNADPMGHPMALSHRHLDARGRYGNRPRLRRLGTRR